MAAERKMSPKGFLHKLNTGSHSADGFLAQHRTWLETGDLASVVSPILLSLDAKEILPTPALASIAKLVLHHMMAEEVRKGEEAMDRQTREPGKTRPWMATIYNETGEVQLRKNAKGEEEELQQTFNLASDADRWADRRLFDGQDGWHAIVSHTSITIKGEPLFTKVMRGDAIARILKKPRGSVNKSRPKSGGSLSFGVKAGTTRVKFSTG